MGVKVPKWQNKCHWWSSLRPSDHFTNGRQCWTNWCPASRRQTDYRHWRSRQVGYRWNMDAPLWTCKQMSEHGVETHVITQDQGIQKRAFCWQSDVDTRIVDRRSI